MLTRRDELTVCSSFASTHSQQRDRLASVHADEAQSSSSTCSFDNDRSLALLENDEGRAPQQTAHDTPIQPVHPSAHPSTTAMIDAIAASRAFQVRCSGAMCQSASAGVPLVFRPWWAVCCAQRDDSFCAVVLYTLGIVLMNTYYSVTAFIPGSTYAVFIAVSGQSSLLLDIATPAVVVFTTAAHLISWWWVVKHYRWRSAQLRHKSSARMSPTSMQLALFLSLSFVALLVGNLLDPGKFGWLVNCLVWPVGGCVFFWFPFCVPIAQLTTEMEVAIHCLRGIEAALQTSLTEERRAVRTGHPSPCHVASCEMASEAYMDVYRLIESTSQRQRTVLPLQLGTLMLALLLNGWHLFVASAQRTAMTKLFDPRAFLHISLSVTCLTLLLLLYVLIHGGRLRIAGMSLQRTLGQRQAMLPLCQQMEFCAPVVRVLGSTEFFNLTRVGALLFSYLTFYLIGVLRTSGVPIRLAVQ